MNFLILIQLIFLVSCSFKAEEESKNSTKTINIHTDSDGDQISDVEERERGLDPNISDIPELNISFLQNYKISVGFKNDEAFSVDTRIHRDNPNFKFRVGSLFMKDNAQKRAAKIGRFSGSSSGSIEQKDYSWYKYPEIQASFIHKKLLEYSSKKKDNNVLTRTIDLESSILLKNTGVFSQIEKLEVNFYYYSHLEEKYKLVHTQMIDEVFQAGVRESFSVKVENAPAELIEESYLRRGEFLISEVKDFYIPELETSYSNLMASVKEKTIPVFVSTPIENTFKYVSLKDSTTFTGILEKLYGSNFKVSDRSIDEIQQFKNNLPEFKYLSQIKNIEKQGRWFVMTNKLKKHYLKHSYTKNDSISLTYLTGLELGNSRDEVVSTIRYDVESGKTGETYDLGNITNSSKIELTLSPNDHFGVRLESEVKNYFFKPTCRGRGNCSGANWWVSIDYTVNRFKDFFEELAFDDSSTTIDSFELKINGEKYPLQKLIDEGLALVDIDENDSGTFLNLTISDLSKLVTLDPSRENMASFVIKPLKSGEESEGLILNKVTGKKTSLIQQAVFFSYAFAWENNLSISPSSWNFINWEKYIKWGVDQSLNGVTNSVDKGEIKNFYEVQTLDLISTVTNFTN